MVFLVLIVLSSLDIDSLRSHEVLLPLLRFQVLFACFKRADKREVKVAQLAGAVGELSAYHHGEQSLMGTIINLAQVRGCCVVFGNCSLNLSFRISSGPIT